MKQPRKYSKNKKKIRFLEMESLRQQIEKKTKKVFAEWIEEQGQANANSNSNMSNHDDTEGDGLSSCQRWLKSVEG